MEFASDKSSAAIKPLVFLPYPLDRIPILYLSFNKLKRNAVWGVLPDPPALRFPMTMVLSLDLYEVKIPLSYNLFLNEAMVPYSNPKGIKRYFASDLMPAKIYLF